jgi:hypothetical protein
VSSEAKDGNKKSKGNILSTMVLQEKGRGARERAA